MLTWKDRFLYEDYRNSYFYLQIVESDNVSFSNELAKLKSVEEEFAKVLSEKEQVLKEKSSLESECCRLKEKEKQLLKDFEDLKTEMKNSENNATLNQTIEVRKIKYFKKRKKW
jgi:hypothetical protein